MRNLTNTMIAWTPPTRLDYDTAGQIALIPHPWRNGPFPYAKDFGASLKSVREAGIEDRKAMLKDAMERIVADGFPVLSVCKCVMDLEEF